MGLQDKLESDGSNLTTWNGTTPPINKLATKSSELHYTYSVNGQNKSAVNSEYQSYEDGVTNILPLASTLDLNGINPTGPLRVNGYGKINNTFQKGQYLNNLPK